MRHRTAKFSSPTWSYCAKRYMAEFQTVGPSQWMLGSQQWRAGVVAPPSVDVWLAWYVVCLQHWWSVCNSRRGTTEPCHPDICTVCLMMTLVHGIVLQHVTTCNHVPICRTVIMVALWSVFTGWLQVRITAKNWRIQAILIFNWRRWGWIHLLHWQSVEY